MVDSGPVEKNVEAVLMNAKVFRRRPGDVPYPVEHTGASSSTCDIWDNMFFQFCCQNVTMHQFDKPPAVVLDLGCGSGYWAITAARQWKNSTIVGYDVRNIQPRLFALDPYKEIAHRVKWVHGNLLDGLPFSSSHFDFVRIVNIGLGVPEDEWQNVFEEVARVMKSGGVIEVIEEDPIFPCAQPPQRASRTRPRPSQISIDLPPFNSLPSGTLSSKSTMTVMSDPWSATLDERFELNSPKSTYTLNSFTQSTAPSPQPTLSELHPYLSYTPREPSMSEPNRTPDPRDHSKLKAAWDAMLYSRFLAANPLSVLPFYLSSSFVDVKSNPPLKVLLPPNSSADGASTSRSSAESCPESATIGDYSVYPATNETCSASTRSSKSDPSATASPFGEAQCPFSMFWSTMHLANTVHKVTGCKEAIWNEYKVLYDSDGPLVTRTARPDEARAMSTKSSTRETFDDEWASWQNDMADRIGMRASLMSEFGWPEPPGERPDWRVWRSMVAKVQLSEESRSFDSSLTPSDSEHEAPNLCRTLRGWVGWKP
ncbi:hypothetical protein D9615_004452 [Tricholomella constricta]|uniref:Methyltransferase domain-containing protein n=1 Tax=Tricholomella constricta TaxID=117010 RepID=A0A8H5M670_9AGAR|nr:hypothetical protein D9615_004452 [Tricholomella constricta]